MTYARLPFYFFALLCGMTSSGFQTAWAGDLIQFHTTNIQALRGNHYELGPKKRTIITLEHASGWSVGDLYAFCDLSLKEGDSDDDLYCEFTPRLSWNKITGKNVSYGILKDILLAAQTEQGEDGLARYSYGIGIDLNLPHFKFFKVNSFIRNNPDRKDKTFQIYTAWSLPFKAAGAKFVFEGFVDIFGEEGGTTVPSQLTQPRLLLDVGDLVWNKQGQFFAGVEYQYWHNKFGIDGVTESVPQAQIKWVF